MLYTLSKLTALASCAFAVASAHAQDWPAKPIKIILGVSPGGLIDTSARLLGTELSAKLGQPVIVENRPGANTTIGANAAASAPGDGYTFFYGGLMSASPVFVKNNAVDAATQLKPVSIVLSAPFFLFVNSKVPAKNIDELLAYSNQHPKALNFGDGAPLSTMVMHAVASRIGLTYTPIPYKGSAPSAAALLAGDIQMTLDTAPPYIQHVKAGTVRVMLNTSNGRSPLFPDAPAVAEVKKGAELNAASVLSMWAPNSTPDAIVNRMSSEIAALSRNPEFRAKFRASTAVDPIGSTPAELLKSFLADKALYTEAAKQTGFVPQ